MKNTLIWLGVLMLAPTALLSGQNLEAEIPTVTRTYALKGVTIIPQPGRQIDSGTVVVRDGLIEAVGADVAVPADAKVLEADSLFVYPGFIDGLSHTGTPRKEKDENDDDERPKDPGNPPNEKAGITPEANVRDHLDPRDRTVAELRELGFTMAHAVPRGRMLPGSGALILLTGDAADEMILREQTALFAQFQGARRMYPATTIGVMAKFRDLYRQAEGALAHRTAYAARPVGASRPVSNRVLEAFFPVIEGDMPVFMVTENIKDVHRALALQQDLGFPLVLTELKQGWLAADIIAANDLPVFLSLELPDQKKENEKEETPELSEEMEKLEARRAAAMAEYESQAAVLRERGVAFGFSTLNAKAKDIRENLRRMVAAGLSETDALAALTTQPARLLGVDEVAGTIAPGKIANLVVTDAPYFSEDANVRFVLVDGDLYEYEPKSKGKADPDAQVDVAGKWNYTIDLESVGMSEMTGLIELQVVDGRITGTVTYPLGNQVRDIRDVRLTGNELLFSTDFQDGGETIATDFRLLIDGDTFEGVAETPSYGSFDMDGSRNPRPKY